MQPALIFDIKTVPDLEGARRVCGFEGLSDEDTLNAIKLKRQIETGADLPKHFLHRIVAISVVMKTQDSVKIWSLGEDDSDEKSLIKQFFAEIERFRPMLITWNGGSFHLPILNYRALLHGIPARSYWEVKDFENDQTQLALAHIDLMNVMANYQIKTTAELNEIAQFIGLPAKQSLSDTDVLNSFLAGDIKKIRDDCEWNVMHIYLVYLRFQLIRDWLTETQYNQACQEFAQLLNNANNPHWQAYHQAWIK